MTSTSGAASTGGAAGEPADPNRKYGGFSRRKQEQQIKEQEQHSQWRSKYEERAQDAGIIDIPELEEEGKEDLTRVVGGWVRGAHRAESMLFNIRQAGMHMLAGSRGYTLHSDGEPRAQKAAAPTGVAPCIISMGWRAVAKPTSLLTRHPVMTSRVPQCIPCSCRLQRLPRCAPTRCKVSMSWMMTSNTGCPLHWTMTSTSPS
jgi:hypothetical protein